MKSTVEQLNTKEKAALALLFGTDAFQALKKICQLEIDGVAKDALASTEINQVYFFRGEASMAKKLPKLVEQIYKESGKQKQDI